MPAWDGRDKRPRAWHHDHLATSPRQAAANPYGSRGKSWPSPWPTPKKNLATRGSWPKASPLCVCKTRTRKANHFVSEGRVTMVRLGDVLPSQPPAACGPPSLRCPRTPEWPLRFPQASSPARLRQRRRHPRRTRRCSGAPRHAGAGQVSVPFERSIGGTPALAGHDDLSRCRHWAGAGWYPPSNSR